MLESLVNLDLMHLNNKTFSLRPTELCTLLLLSSSIINSNVLQSNLLPLVLLLLPAAFEKAAFETIKNNLQSICVFEAELLNAEILLNVKQRKNF